MTLYSVESWASERHHEHRDSAVVPEMQLEGLWIESAVQGFVVSLVVEIWYNFKECHELLEKHLPEIYGAT
jgi:hypothetical protein